MPELVDATYVLHRLVEICTENPKTVNPVVNSGPNTVCVYQTETDPNNNCLIGRLAREEGWRMPPPIYVGAAETAAETYGWPVDESAQEVLSAVQWRADTYVDGGKVRAWGGLLPFLREQQAGLELADA